MNPDSFSSTPTMASSDMSGRKHPSRLDTTAFYVFLITVILAPLAFLPTPYIILDAVKTVLIAIGTLLTAVLYGVIAYKEKSVTLPPKSVVWSGILVIASLIVSAFTSLHSGKSFFGQGFELNTVSFLLILFTAGLVTYVTLQRKAERATVLYVGMTISFIVLALVHGLRLLIGQSFLTLGVLSAMTSTLVGNWYDLAAYSIAIALIALPALIFLPLSRRIKIVYWVLLVVALVGAFVINSMIVWFVATVVFLVITIAASSLKPRSVGSALGTFIKRIAWLPFVITVIAGILFWKGTPLASPVIAKFNASYATLTLPWQLTLDVNAGAIKDFPLFGIGPNQFSQAFLAYKPVGINTTYAWSAEFSYAFSLLATFVATQGVVGVVTWLLFLVLLGIMGVRILRRLPADSHARFVLVSSVSTATFLWILAALTVPSHSLLLFTFVVTAIALSTGVANGILTPCVWSPRSGARSKILFTLVTLVLIIVGIVWGVMYVKDAAALSYFGSGVKTLNANGDPIAADRAFGKAQSLNPSDIYLRARAEAGIAHANKLISTVTQSTSASSSQAIAAQVVDILNTAVKYAQAAIAYDPNNYYNYVSEARVSELATAVKMDKAYENTINAYTTAIRLNPLNPSLYLNLAQFQVSQNKLDDSLKTLGAALQVKNNYLDAIFLLSQVEAAQGKLADAIVAAQVAVQINPQNSVLLFQLGLLEYNNKDYASAAKALEAAVKIQPDYANAQYFLGLAYVRLNDIQSAITQFTNLAKSNPDNQEVSFILTNLQAGKSPFADAKPPVTPSPEKRSTLPIKEKKK